MKCSFKFSKVIKNYLVQNPETAHLSYVRYFSAGHSYAQIHDDVGLWFFISVRITYTRNRCPLIRRFFFFKTQRLTKLSKSATINRIQILLYTIIIL